RNTNSLSVNIQPGSNVHFQLYDLSGRILRAIELNNAQNQIDLQGFPNGIYIYTINGLHSKSNGLIPINQD
ncbi:MAG: T9SS type A sorting domain-containing protein, partial [Bacteroidetes bacterium]|nr:T9SS type A sorting domain-containing protein [Bacteroidota bacterium]